MEHTALWYKLIVVRNKSHSIISLLSEGEGTVPCIGWRGKVLRFLSVRKREKGSVSVFYDRLKSLQPTCIGNSPSVHQSPLLFSQAFTTEFRVHWGQHPLRPEFAESTYFLYKVRLRLTPSSTSCLPRRDCMRAQTASFWQIHWKVYPAAFSLGLSS